MTYSENPINAIPDNTHLYLGLTKREYFAAMVMQGLCANPVYAQMILDKIPEKDAADFISIISVEQADNLINQLNK